MQRRTATMVTPCISQALATDIAALVLGLALGQLSLQ